MTADPRALAAQALAPLLRGQRSLNQTLPEVLQEAAERDRALIQHLCYDTLRLAPALDRQLRQLLRQPLKNKDSDIQALLLLGAYQLQHSRVPPHAAVSASAGAARALGKTWAVKLINGVLRHLQREGDALRVALADDPVFTSAHPQWLYEQLRKAWPAHLEDLLAANNTPAPMTLRVNQRQLNRADYLSQLRAAGLEATEVAASDVGLTLATPCEVNALPDFAQGAVSVQDASAQRAAALLDPQPGERVLDACCAPGGKTAHLLERQPALAQLVAVDSDRTRLARVADTLARLQLNAELIHGDASDTAPWWDGQPFQRILLDAPCSATGVIRRHPDIKLLRRPTDIAKLAATQRALLDALWPLLAPGGRLVYATCSVLPAENSAVVTAFVAAHSDAQIKALPAGDVDTEVGQQWLPQVAGHDGFYYAVLEKTAH